jgi:hypothetical protein
MNVVLLLSLVFQIQIRNQILIGIGFVSAELLNPDLNC